MNAPARSAADEAVQTRPDRVRGAAAAQATTGRPDRAAPDRHRPPNDSIAFGPFILLSAFLAVLAVASARFETPLLTTLGLVVASILSALAGWQAQKMLLRQSNDLEARLVAERACVERLTDKLWEAEEREGHHAGLADTLGDLVVHRDRQGRITYANAALASLFHKSPEDLMGRTFADLGVARDALPDGGDPASDHILTGDVALRTPSGTRWYAWNEHVVREEKTGAVTRRAVARDITARKAAEDEIVKARHRAESGSAAKSRFLAMVSHEIRTPLHGILGMARLISDTDLTSEQRTYAEAVSRSGAALLSLIEDLLDFSQIEAGRLSLVPQPTSVRGLVEEVSELLAPRAYDKGLGLGSHVASDVPTMVSIDGNRVRQVLLNLAGNAIKFTETGGVLISATVAGDAGEGRWLALSVSDSGAGLSAEEQGRIFREFEQARSGADRPHGGVGLGLAISQRIAAAMNATISVRSEEGRGAIFTLAIPLAGTEADGAEPPAGSGASVLAGRNYLVISPHREEAEGLVMTLRDRGAHCIFAERLAEIGGQAETQFDAVLADAALDREGEPLLRQLAEAGIGAARGIVMLRPQDKGTLVSHKSRGFDAFLVRPVREETLLRLLLGYEMASPAAGERRDRHGGDLPLGGAKLDVLLAEDNEISAALAKAALDRAGHRVVVARDGQEAMDAFNLALANAAPFDVALIDLHMPRVEGLDVLTAIRRFEAGRDLWPTPIVVLSADGQAATREKALAAGATRFLTKPVDPFDLIRAIAEARGGGDTQAEQAGQAVNS